MSKGTRARRTQPTRAQLKAYEARRAAERLRATTIAEESEAPQARAVEAPRGTFGMSRAREMAIIRSDLRRLLMILAVEAVVLIAATIVLR